MGHMFDTPVLAPLTCFPLSNPELIELVSEEPINPEKIKKYIEEHPQHIHDIADKVTSIIC